MANTKTQRDREKLQAIRDQIARTHLPDMPPRPLNVNGRWFLFRALLILVDAIERLDDIAHENGPFTLELFRSIRRIEERVEMLGDLAGRVGALEADWHKSIKREWMLNERIEQLAEELKQASEDAL